MDTNQMALEFAKFIATFTNAVPVTPSVLAPVVPPYIMPQVQTVTLGMGQTVLVLIGMIITAVPTTLAAIAGFRQARTNAGLTTIATEKIDKQTISLDKVHEAVNSSHTALVSENNSLKTVVLDLSKSISTLEEKVRGLVLEGARVAAIPVVPEAVASQQRAELDILRAESLRRHEEANKRQVENFKTAIAEMRMAESKPVPKRK